MFNKYSIWLWPNSLQNEDMRQATSRMKEAKIDIVMPLLGSPAPEDRTIGQEELEERLELLIASCKENGIQVHGCFDELKFSGKEEKFCQKRQDGSSNLLLCPANPQNREWVLKRLDYYLTHFNLDGITLEDSYIYQNMVEHDPANHQSEEAYRSIPTCFCDYCKDHAPDDPDARTKYKQDGMTALVKSISQRVKASQLQFSMACRMPYSQDFYAPYKDEIPYIDGWKYCQSRDGLCADWGRWFEEGLLDFVCPMSYFRDPRMVELQALESCSLIPNPEENVWMGLGLSKITAEYFNSQLENDINTAENLEIIMKRLDEMGQKNIVFFSYSMETFKDEHIKLLSSMKADG